MEMSSLLFIIQILNYIVDSSDDDSQLQTVTVDSPANKLTSSTTGIATTETTTSTSGHHTVRVVITNGDSESDSDDHHSKKSKYKLPRPFSKHSSNEVVELELGQLRDLKDSERLSTNIGDCVETVNESLTKHRLKPKTVAPHQSQTLPAHILTRPTDNNNANSDVVLSLRDLELEEFEGLTEVHSTSKKKTDEHIV